MFCNGKCKKGNNRCGLLLDVFMKNDMTGSEKILEKCAIIGVFESMVRQEQGQIRIQSAVESSRNEGAKWMRNQNETLATGFLGLIYATQEDEEAQKKIKVLAQTRAKMIKYDEDITDIGNEGEEEDGTV
jgi:hypothetical protein